MLWALTERGRRMPLDPEPYEGDDPRGLFVLRGRDEPVPTAIAVPADAFPDEPHYRSHFATCTHPARHRRRP
jgi:hypothetical protein